MVVWCNFWRGAGTVKPIVPAFCVLFGFVLCSTAYGDASIRIRDASGFPASTTIVGVNFSSSPDAVAVNFRVNYDVAKLQFIGAEAGPTAIAANKDVDAETPSSGTVSIVVYGLNNNVIDSGRLVNLNFVILGTASVGQQLSLVGTNPASTSTDAKPIPTTITDATISVTQCTSPSAPTNVVASDGTYSDRVGISWNAANGASAYIVYRGASNVFANAAQLGVTSDTNYSDSSAAPASLASPGGCVATASLTFTSQYYWVASQNICGTSAPVGPDKGYRGGTKSAAATTTFETVLPTPSAGVGIQPDDTLAIRLRADEPITEVWGRVTAEDMDDSSVQWVPTPEMDGRDGWVVYEPQVLWFPGETVLYTVGGVTSDGAVLGPLTYAFVVAVDLPSSAADKSVPQPKYTDFDGNDLLRSGESNDSVELLALTADAVPALAGALAPQYRVVPDGLFTTPQRIWLPVPKGEMPDNLDLFYYRGTAEDGTWYPAANVQGWMVPGSELALDHPDASYLGVLVNYGGIVCLRRGNLSASTAAASLGPSAHGIGSVENLLPLALTLLVLALANYRAQRRKRHQASSAG